MKLKVWGDRAMKTFPNNKMNLTTHFRHQMFNGNVTIYTSLLKLHLKPDESILIREYQPLYGVMPLAYYSRQMESHFEGDPTLPRYPPHLPRETEDTKLKVHQFPYSHSPVNNLQVSQCITYEYMPHVQKTDMVLPSQFKQRCKQQLNASLHTVAGAHSAPM